MVFQQFNLVGHMTILQNVMEAPLTVAAPARAEVGGRGTGVPRQGGPSRQMRCLSGAAVGRQQQTRRNRRGLCMEPPKHCYLTNRPPALESRA